MWHSFWIKDNVTDSLVLNTRGSGNIYIRTWLALLEVENWRKNFSWECQTLFLVKKVQSFLLETYCVRFFVCLSFSIYLFLSILSQTKNINNIVKKLNLYIILLCTILYHFFSVSIHYCKGVRSATFQSINYM